MGLLGLPGLLEGEFDFMILLEGGLNHGVSHVRRSDKSADKTEPLLVNLDFEVGFLRNGWSGSARVFLFVFAFKSEIPCASEIISVYY